MQILQVLTFSNQIAARAFVVLLALRVQRMRWSRLAGAAGAGRFAEAMPFTLFEVDQLRLQVLDHVLDQLPKLLIQEDLAALRLCRERPAGQPDAGHYVWTRYLIV